jgi:hypothetical protein
MCIFPKLTVVHPRESDERDQRTYQGAEHVGLRVPGITLGSEEFIGALAE